MDYIARRVWRARLSGGQVPEAIVTSVGPPIGSLGFHSADLQVLSWDAIARRWTVVFDAQKVASEPSSLTQTSNAQPGAPYPDGAQTKPLLDPTARVTIEQVGFGHLLPGKGEQLVFGELSSYGGSGAPGELVVVDLHDGAASVVYEWSGDGGARFTTRGDRIDATAAEYWTASDPHCCAARSYRFTVGRSSSHSLTELTDQRPWLGVTLKPLTRDDPRSPVKVVAVIPGSPAAKQLRLGDVLLAVQNPPRIRNQAQELLGPVIYDQLTTLNAGDTAHLFIRRDGRQLLLKVKLGSLAAPSVGNVLPSSDYELTTI